MDVQKVSWQDRIANRPRVIGVRSNTQWGSRMLYAGQVIQLPAHDFHGLRAQFPDRIANLTKSALGTIISANPVPWLGK